MISLPSVRFVVTAWLGWRLEHAGYLAQLARAHGARLATFDQAMAKLHGDVADLVSAS